MIVVVVEVIVIIVVVELILAIVRYMNLEITAVAVKIVVVIAVVEMKFVLIEILNFVWLIQENITEQIMMITLIVADLIRITNIIISMTI